MKWEPKSTAKNLFVADNLLKNQTTILTKQGNGEVMEVAIFLNKLLVSLFHMSKNI